MRRRRMEKKREEREEEGRSYNILLTRFENNDIYNVNKISLIKYQKNNCKNI